MSGRLTLLDALPADSTGTDGRISGTPAALHPAATYTLIAMDRDGDRATLTFILTIERVRVMNAGRARARWRGGGLPRDGFTAGGEADDADMGSGRPAGGISRDVHGDDNVAGRGVCGAGGVPGRAGRPDSIPSLPLRRQRLGRR